MTLFAVNELGYVLPLNNSISDKLCVRHLNGFKGIFVLEGTRIRFATGEELSKATYQIPMPLFGGA